MTNNSPNLNIPIMYKQDDMNMNSFCRKELGTFKKLGTLLDKLYSEYMDYYTQTDENFGDNSFTDFEELLINFESIITKRDQIAISYTIEQYLDIHKPDLDSVSLKDEIIEEKKIYCEKVSTFLSNLDQINSSYQRELAKFLRDTYSHLR